MRPSESRTDTLEARAHEMRHAPTLSEARLFETIRGKRLGVAFKRQVPLLGRYIVDLLAASIRLVVEIDGGYHSERTEADAKRDRALVRAGYRVLRLDAELVMRDCEAAVARVREVISQS
jgi:very-short-patch-repair endonuclease